MTADEAEAFIARNEGGRTCVSFMRDAQAQVVTLDYQKRNSARRPWPIIAAAGAAIAAGGAAAYYQLNPPVLMGRMTGVMAAPTGYSPFNTTAVPQQVARASFIAAQLKSDTALQPIVQALPDGVEVLDLQYGIYPSNLFARYGRCVILGRRTSAPPSPAGNAPALNPGDVRMVIYLMPQGYPFDADLVDADEPHPLHAAGGYGANDVLIWSDDAELERVVTAQMHSQDQMTPNPTTLQIEK